jgi:hypothetical protein
MAQKYNITLNDICTANHTAVHAVQVCVLDENLPTLWIHAHTKLKIKTSVFSAHSAVKKLKVWKPYLLSWIHKKSVDFKFIRHTLLAVSAQKSKEVIFNHCLSCNIK